MAKHKHISRRHLLAARRGQLSWRHLADLLLERLAGLCPACREEVEAVAALEIPADAYGRPVTRAIRIQLELQRFEQDEAAAPGLLDSLRARSAEQRLLMVRNAPERFSNLALGERVLGEIRACLPGDPEGSLGWARVLEAIANAHPDPFHPQLVLAIAYQGNAHRALGDFEEARARLYQARNLLETYQVSDLDVTADLYSLLASLCSDLGRFEDATDYLEQASSFLNTLGDEERLARVLIQLAIVHALRQDTTAALDADYAALRLLDPHAHPVLYFNARFNLAYHMLDADDPERARDLLDWVVDLLDEHQNPHARLRVSWLQARISGALGDVQAAEHGLLTTRNEFASQGHGFNTAIVSLELATLYHGQRRHDDVLRVASEAVELFQAHALHQEALAALVLVRDAARAHTLERETLLNVAAFLRRAERSPGARLHSSN